MRGLARAFRAVQMYLPNSPLRPKAIIDAQRVFESLWTHMPTLSLRVTERSLRCEGRDVHVDEDRGPSGLPWLLYRDGVRQVDLSPGFEERELEAFLEILHANRIAAADGDDLVTTCWVANFEHLKIRHVELLADFETLLTESESYSREVMPDLSTPSAAQLLESVLPGDGPPPAVRLFDEQSSSLYFLEPAELSRLRQEIQREYASDGLPAVIDALFDILEGQQDLELQFEVMDILDTLIIEFLQQRSFIIVSVLIREARRTLDRGGPLDPSIQSALVGMMRHISQPDTISALLTAVDRGEFTARSESLETLLAELAGSSLPPLLVWYAGAATSSARVAMEQAIQRAASKAISEFARQLDHGDPHVVGGAVRLARLVASPALVPSLTRLLSHDDAAIRANAVEALTTIASSRAMEAVVAALDDSVRDVRVAALKGLAERNHPQVLPRLTRDLERRTVRGADLSEKLAFFEAFGAICGDSGVAALDGILNGRGLLGYRESSEMRACAAHALGRVGTRAARATLQRASSASDLIVRSAVSRAMRAAP